jgi:hypothetical protein
LAVIGFCFVSKVAILLLKIGEESDSKKICSEITSVTCPKTGSKTGSKLGSAFDSSLVNNSI